MQQLQAQFEKKFYRPSGRLAGNDPQHLKAWSLSNQYPGINGVIAAHNHHYVK
jgi:hypothetical protein